MKTIAACIICLVVGLLLGRLLPVAEPEVKDGAAIQGAVAGGAPDRVRGGTRTAQDTPARHAPVKPVAAPEDDVMVDGVASDPLVTVPASLIEELSMGKGSRDMGQALFSRDGRIEELLKISDQEKAVMQTEWRSVRERVRQLEARSSTAEDLEDGSVKITVPSLVGEMGAMGEGFQSSVKQALGDNRGEVFLALKQVDQIFSPEEGERSYGIKVETIGDGRWRYHMTLEGPAGQRVWVSEKVPDEIRHLTDAAKIFSQIEDVSSDDDECD